MGNLCFLFLLLHDATYKGKLTDPLSDMIAVYIAQWVGYYARGAGLSCPGLTWLLSLHLGGRMGCVFVDAGVSTGVILHGLVGWPGWSSISAQKKEKKGGSK